MSDNKLAIGIDFGTSGIACAYGFLNEKSIPTQVLFNGQGNQNKISAEIILDDNLNVMAFGDDCSSYYDSINEENFHHFYKIKMNLYDRIYKIKSRNSDKEVDIQYIIKLMLIEIKKKAIEQIKITIPSLNENKIHWVITVPAIWEMKSKQIMINAAQEAGMIREDDDISNFFALEPEAASIYYQNSPQANQEIKDSEDPFIVCDFGGGTVDIVTQRKIRTNSGFQFIEEYPPIGGNYGCNIINENFMERIIKELFGEECFNEAKINICKNRYND
jgi:molecular chaperone DnaK (HSP70)